MTSKCLIVDDSEVVRKVARRIIETMGFECAEAANGDAAYKVCEEIEPDSVFIDWNMPVMSGYEFLEKIRERSDLKQPKVIFCTMENNVQHIKRALEAGADDYIMKPFDCDIIRTKLMHLGLLNISGKASA